MRRIRSRRGLTFVDVIVTIFLLGVCGVIFCSTFPAAWSSTRQAREYKVATAIAEQKMEQLRAVKYESLTYTLLASVNLIDADVSTLPYSFTKTDSVDTKLPDGSAQLNVEDYSTELKRVTLTVAWTGSDAKQRQVELSTFFSDKRPRTYAPPASP